MNKDLLIFLESFLSTTLKLDKAGVAALFEADGSPKADVINQLLDKDKERVKDLTKGKFDEGFKAAEKKVKTDLEKELKDKFGVDSDKQGVELVEAIITAKTPQGAELTDEQVKKHKAYLDLQESLNAKVKEAVKAKETEFNGYKAQVERKETFSTVKAEALKLFDELKVVLPADAAKAERLKNLFLKEIEAGNYRVDNGRIILVNDKGEDEVDEHGNRKDFTAIVKAKITDTFEVAASDPKDSPGAKDNPKPAPGAKVIIKSKDDYIKLMGEAGNDAAKRAEVTTAYQEFQKSST
jgi:hypothetical protein